MRALNYISVTVCLACLLLSGCKKDEITVAGNSISFSEDQQTKSASLLVGSDGGTIAFGDGTLLEIPANALAKQTNISISRVKGAAAMSETGFDYVRLEPAGLHLTVAAKLKMKYSVPSNSDEDYLSAWICGLPVDDNDSTDGWERASVVTQDKRTSTVEISVPHFSWYRLGFDRPLEVVLEIPGEYLMKSDLLFGLTGGHWMPGHAALYLGTQDPSSQVNNGSTIIESTIRTGSASGVDFGDLWSDFQMTHIYMGARRYAGTLTQTDRDNIATFAVAQRGKGYFAVGQGGIGCYSCVGLTEASYDANGKSIVPASLEYPFLIPYVQYDATFPVNEISVKSGEGFSIGVKGVVWVSGTILWPTFSDDPQHYSVSATNLPNGATFESNTFSWTPSSTDVGGSYNVGFTVNAMSKGQARQGHQNLLIHVLEGLTAPTVTTGSVSYITSSSARCGANVTSQGSSAVTSRGLCWSTSQNPTTSDSRSSDGTGTGGFIRDITGLSALTTYYVRAYATNAVSTSYGNQVNFTTLAAGSTAPTVTTSSISSIASNSATGGGTVTAQGSSSVTARGVCWSTSQTPTTSNSKTSDGTGTGSFTSSLFGLYASTTYYVRAYATNSAGTSYGSQVSFATTPPSQGAWSVQASGVSSDLNDVFFVSSTTGWTVGADGVILKTTNGGTNWISQSSGTTYRLLKVQFMDSNVGYICGGNGANPQGIILKTTNGGANWSALNTGTNSEVASVYFASATVGWAVQYDGHIVKTTNSGTSWTMLSDGESARLLCVRFFDSNNGWVTGANGRVLRTTNGGSSWTSQDLSSNLWLDDIAILTSTKAVLSGSGQSGEGAFIFQTTNAGANWIQSVIPSFAGLSRLSFPTSAIGYATGHSTVLKTMDGGTSWSALTLPTPATLWYSGVYFANSTTGWVVGEGGRIMKTTTGGQ